MGDEDTELCRVTAFTIVYCVLLLLCIGTVVIYYCFILHRYSRILSENSLDCKLYVDKKNCLMLH
jgi:hypothetical protein